MKVLLETEFKKVVDDGYYWRLDNKTNNSSTKICSYFDLDGKIVVEPKWYAFYYWKTNHPSSEMLVRLYRGYRPKATKTFKDLQAKLESGEYYSVGYSTMYSPEALEGHREQMKKQKLREFLEK